MTDLRQLVLNFGIRTKYPQSTREANISQEHTLPANLKVGISISQSIDYRQGIFRENTFLYLLTFRGVIRNSWSSVAENLETLDDVSSGL